MNTAKYEALLTKHASVLAKTGRELAMNFDVPARVTIAMACAEMGISRKQWDALQSYRIAKEQEEPVRQCSVCPGDCGALGCPTLPGEDEMERARRRAAIRPAVDL